MADKNFSEIEDELISQVEALGIFATVDSAGRSGDLDDVGGFKNYPACSLMFLELDDTGVKSRPVSELSYVAFVQDKHLGGEQEAAQSTYQLVKTTRAAIHGHSFNIDNIEPFTCTGVKLADYHQGVITYALKFTARLFEAPVVDA